MKCRIDNITELDGITLKSSHAQRIGRVGELVHVHDGQPMLIKYSDGHGILMTSDVQNISENPKKFTVKTQNSIYVLDKI